MKFLEADLSDHLRHLYNLKAGVFQEKEGATTFDMKVLGEIAEAVAHVEPSQFYHDHLLKVRQAFQAELLASPEFHDKLKRWDTLDPATEQTAYLDKCLKRLAELQSTCGVKCYAAPFTYYNNPEGTDAYVNFIINDNPALDLIGINLAKNPEATQDLLVALQSIAHEQTHMFNASLNRAYYVRAIDATHPLHDEAQYFREVYRLSASIHANLGEYCARDRNPYLLQLDERAAYDFADGLFDGLFQEVRFQGPPKPDMFRQYPEPGPEIH